MLNFKTTNNYFERTENLTKYYQDVREYDMLSPEEEKKCFEELNVAKRKYHKHEADGDTKNMAIWKKKYENIRKYIINANLRFVISVAKIYASNNNFLDLINEGNIGLVEAVDTFDPSVGARFQTHAVYLIRQKINLYRQGNDLIIKKNNVSKTYHVISNMTNRFMQEFQREPTSDELRDYINEHYPNMGIKDASDCLTVRMTSIDEPIERDDEYDITAGLINQFNVTSSSANDYERVSEIEHYTTIIDSLLKDFSDRDKSIIKMHFGIGQEYGRQVPAHEIGKIVGLTPERVRQIIAQAMKDIKEEYGKRITNF